MPGGYQGKTGKAWFPRQTWSSWASGTTRTKWTSRRSRAPGPRGDQGPQGPKGDPGESISAPSIVSPLSSIVVSETGIASLQCEVKGNQIPQITWLKENSRLLTDKRIVQTRGGLMIRDATSQDGGVYTCKARNILGVVTSTATLTVQGNYFPVLFS